MGLTQKELLDSIESGESTICVVNGSLKNLLVKNVIEKVNETADAEAAAEAANTAAEAANSATETANAAAESATAAATSATTATDAANAAAESATTASESATTAAESANTAAENATTAAEQVEAAVETANEALTAANAANTTANEATEAANTAAEAANAAIEELQEQVTTASEAAATISEAVEKAETAVETANTANETATTANETASGLVDTCTAAAETANTAATNANTVANEVSTAKENGDFDGVGVSSIELVDNEIIVTLTDGTQTNVGSVDWSLIDTSAFSVTNVAIEDNILYFTLSDGSVINAGTVDLSLVDISPLELGIDSITVDSENHLIFNVTYRDGESAEVDAGEITMPFYTQCGVVSSGTFVSVGYTEAYISSLYDVRFYYRSATVTFDKEFAETPVVTVTPVASSAAIFATVTNISTTGFTVYLHQPRTSSSNTGSSVNVQWQATGTIATETAE